MRAARWRRWIGRYASGSVVKDAAPSSFLSRGALWLLAVLLIVLYAPTAVWLWGRWTLSVWHNAHGLLIPPVVAYFVYQELKERPHLPVSSSAWGFVFLVPAMILQALDAGMHTELLSAVSLVLALPGLALLLWAWSGRAPSRSRWSSWPSRCPSRSA